MFSTLYVLKFIHGILNATWVVPMTFRDVDTANKGTTNLDALALDLLPMCLHSGLHFQKRCFLKYLDVNYFLLSMVG